MKANILRCVVAAIAMLLVVSEAQAQYYNVDYQTLPLGPIELENKVATPIVGGYILTGDAVNLTSQTYNNVLYLNEWMFDGPPSNAPSAFSYAGGNLWTSTDGNAWQVPTPDGTLQPSDVSPLPFAWTSTVYPAAGPAFIVNPNDLYPYVNIGTVGPFASVPFTETVNSTSNFNFDFVSSFISTTPPVLVPEPSSLILAALGAIGLIAVRWRRRKLLFA
jgi:hypothetical protein